MAVRLTITNWADPAGEYERSFVQDGILFGRTRSADVCLPDMSVSTRHAEIKLKGSDYAVVDLGSVNGTEVGGKKLIAHRPHKLKNGDIIAIGGFRIRFHAGVGATAEESRNLSIEQAKEMMARMLARSGTGTTTRTLVVSSGPSKGRRYELPLGPTTMLIGRGRDCGIVLDDPDISRRHAELVIETDGIFVRDLGSRNGLFVDGTAVEAARVDQGVVFELGQSALALEHPATRCLSEIFEAPELATASFALGKDDAKAGGWTPPDEVTRPIDKGIPDTPAVAAAPASPVPKVGPADPLAADARRDDDREFTENRQPPPGGNDLGLIIVGAIIVVAAVAGLIYLFS